MNTSEAVVLFAVGALVVFVIWYLVSQTRCEPERKHVRFATGSPMDAVASRPLPGEPRDNMSELDSAAQLPRDCVAFCYLNGCGPCKAFAPEVNLASRHARVPFVRLEHHKVPGDWGVRGYPTLFLVRNGERTRYEGPRRAEALYEAVQKHFSQ